VEGRSSTIDLRSSVIEINNSSGKAACVPYEMRITYGNRWEDTRDLPQLGRYMECVGVSASIGEIRRECRGIHLNQDDIQNVSVY
jgi:hypothetical protein